MQRRDFLRMCSGGGLLALAGCGSQSNKQPTMFDLLAQQKGMEFFVEERELDGKLTPYVVGISANGETRFEDAENVWLFYVGDDPDHRDLIKKSPSDFQVPHGKQVYAAYEKRWFAV